jgi:DNA (cytosine-5)-methyltransferase 1
MTAQPELLDVFCGAGGCSVGYHRAGFKVTGVDNKDHPDYPYDLIVADAMDVLKDRGFLSRFVAVHASPPCPRYSAATPEEYREDHPDLLKQVVELLREWGGVWVVENVPRAPVPDPVMICGRAMGLRWFKRHRLFASSVPLMSPGCACGKESPYGVTGDGPEIRDYARNGRKARSVQHAQEIMGIDWMTTWDDLTDAIPPAYCEYLGGQLLEHLASLEVA